MTSDPGPAPHLSSNDGPFSETGKSIPITPGHSTDCIIAAAVMEAAMRGVGLGFLVRSALRAHVEASGYLKNGTPTIPPSE